jgi:hypothetical protein
MIFDGFSLIIKLIFKITLEFIKCHNIKTPYFKNRNDMCGRKKGKYKFGT